MTQTGHFAIPRQSAGRGPSKQTCRTSVACFFGSAERETDLITPGLGSIGMQSGGKRRVGIPFPGLERLAGLSERARVLTAQASQFPDRSSLVIAECVPSLFRVD